MYDPNDPVSIAFARALAELRLPTDEEVHPKQAQAWVEGAYDGLANMPSEEWLAAFSAHIVAVGEGRVRITPPGFDARAMGMEEGTFAGLAHTNGWQGLLFVSRQRVELMPYRSSSVTVEMTKEDSALLTELLKSCSPMPQARTKGIGEYMMAIPGHGRIMVITDGGDEPPKKTG